MCEAKIMTWDAFSPGELIGELRKGFPQQMH